MEAKHLQNNPRICPKSIKALFIVFVHVGFLFMICTFGYNFDELLYYYDTIYH